MLESPFDNEPDQPEVVPDYLGRWPGLYVREGDRIELAPEEDATLARGYPTYSQKGPIKGGGRLTIMTRKSACRAGDEVRVIHVHEVTEPGRIVYIMGPKPVYGEYLDGQPMTPPPPPGDDPFRPGVYSGAILYSPAVDYNYDITSYRFLDPGPHYLEWKLGELCSNRLTIEVTGQETALSGS